MVQIFVRFQDKSSFRKNIWKVDWIGGFFFIAGLTSFLMGISWAGIVFPWASFRSILPIVLGVVGVFLSLIWERYGAQQPFLRKSLFTSSSSIAAYFCAFAQGSILYLGLYYLPFYFMAVLSATAVEAGVNMFAVTCLLLPGSAIVSFLVTRLGRFRWALYLGWTVTTLGCGLVILLPLMGEDIKTSEWAAILVVVGFGNGIVLTSVNFATQSIASSEDCARAASMYAFFRTLGMATGVAIGGSVFQNLMGDELERRSLPVDIARHAESFISQLNMLPPDDPERNDLMDAYNFAFQGIFIVLTGISAAGLLSSLNIRRHSMDQILDSKHKIQR